MTETIVTDFGCDRCGRVEAEHVGEYAACPNRAKGSQATFVSSRWGAYDGHKLAIVMKWGEPYPKVVHPEKGCLKLVCGGCREDYGEEPKPDCPKCGGTGEDPSGQCWLDHFLGEVGREWWELTPWAIDFEYIEPIPILWRGGWDDFAWRPRDAVR